MITDSFTFCGNTLIIIITWILASGYFPIIFEKDMAGLNKNPE
jgi:hypothetical protein